VNEDTGRQLHGWDATTYRADVGSPTMRSPVIGLLLLEVAPDWDALVARLERVSRTVPMLRERVLRGPFGLANPRLGVDPSFDLDFHLRRYRLPQPATWSDVLAEARRISLAQLDPDRPLWRATVLEGLPDGRAAFILKLHHALADGQATVQLGAQIFDFAPDATAPTDLPEPPAAVQPGMLDVLTADVRDTLERAAGRVGGVVRAAPGTAWRAVRDPRGAVGDGVGLARSLARFTLPAGGRSLSPLLRQRGTTYRFATIALPFRDLRTAAKDAGFTVNDAFLSAVAGGMRRYHERHDAPVGELRFNLPISLRTEGAEAANAVTIARFPFGIAEPDPVTRMAAAHEVVDAWRAEPALGLADDIASLGWFVPVGMLAAAAQASDITTSNVPGVPVPTYLAGARILRMYPLVATIGAAINVTMLTYDGGAYVGVSADDSAVAEIAELVEDLRAGFAEVVGKDLPPDDPVPGS
jgi:WS/DGAT/MGAT family acyltransferase